MFSTQDRLTKRTPKGGINREEYINHLVNEFNDSSVQGNFYFKSYLKRVITNQSFILVCVQAQRNK